MNDGDHRLGEPTALRQLVEYGDFECPFCAEAFPGVKRLIGTFRADLLFVFRHFPVASQHPHALRAAEAAEAAARQGRFWEMHDLLFENQHALDVASLRRHAEALGLDVVAFDRDLRDPEVVGKVRSDADSGIVSGVLGTPTFFVNGVRQEGAFHFDQLRAALARSQPMR